jgi:hypothetical protein
VFLTPPECPKRLVFDAKQELEHVLTEQEKPNIRKSCLMLKLHEDIVNGLCNLIPLWVLMKLREEVVGKESQWRNHRSPVTTFGQPHDKIKL